MLSFLASISTDPETWITRITIISAALIAAWKSKGAEKAVKENVGTSATQGNANEMLTKILDRFDNLATKEALTNISDRVDQLSEHFDEKIDAKIKEATNAFADQIKDLHTKIEGMNNGNPN